MKPTGEECHQWAHKGKVRLHSHEGRNVMMDEELATKENQGT
jgi:hypothetical protein